MLSSDDTAWFAAHPHRAFRCRLLADAERGAPAYVPPGPGLAHVVYVRRPDGATVRTLTPMPDFLIAEEDEGRARFAAQGMPNPPPLDGPVERVEPIEASPDAVARIAACLGEAPSPQPAS